MDRIYRPPGVWHDRRMRIVSLLPSTTEILFAIGAGDDVVGVTFECDHPAQARERTIVSTSALPEGLDAALAHLGCTADVLTIAPHTRDEVLVSVGTLGEATGHEAEARALVASLRERLEPVRAEVARA